MKPAIACLSDSPMKTMQSERQDKKGHRATEKHNHTFKFKLNYESYLLQNNLLYALRITKHKKIFRLIKRKNDNKPRGSLNTEFKFH